MFSVAQNVTKVDYFKNISQKPVILEPVFTFHLFPAVLLTPCLNISGPCTFESDQCQWLDISEGQRRWQRQKASNNMEPPTDHTTETGDFRGSLIGGFLYLFYGPTGQESKG